jgi:hypothetical protein
MTDAEGLGRARARLGFEIDGSGGIEWQGRGAAEEFRTGLNERRKLGIGGATSAVGSWNSELGSGLVAWRKLDCCDCALQVLSPGGWRGERKKINTKCGQILTKKKIWTENVTKTKKKIDGKLNEL